MSLPREPEAVQRIVSVISSKSALIDRALGEMVGFFGPLDWTSPLLAFDRTRYYEREMGAPLVRKFAAFERLMPPEELVETKLATNRLESRMCGNGPRAVNIDPGYICLERLVLATGKNYTHRIYLSRGIYADLTLVFHRQGFHALPWTYPDYADPNAVMDFNMLRGRYKARLRGLPVDDRE